MLLFVSLTNTAMCLFQLHRGLQVLEGLEKTLALKGWDRPE